MAEMDEFLSQLTGAEIDAAVLAILGRVLVSFNKRNGPYITPEFGDYTASLIDISDMNIPASYNLEKPSLEELLKVLMNSPANPVGTILSFMGNNPPNGYLKCDGMEYFVADYPALATHIETEFGTVNHFGGDGTNSFCVPDLRGEFLRGTGSGIISTGSGADVGVHQDPTWHMWQQRWTNNWLYTPNVGGSIMNPGGNQDSTRGSSSGRSLISHNSSDSSTGYTYFASRPTNTAVLYCIKY